MNTLNSRNSGVTNMGCKSIGFSPDLFHLVYGTFVFCCVVYIEVYVSIASAVVPGLSDGK